MLLTLLGAYVLVLCLIRFFEAHLIFFPDYAGRLSGDWHPRGLPVEDASIVSSDGVKLHAWWIPNDGAKYTFLAFHGNAGSIADRADVYRFLWDSPANVLAVEYRGYGRSEGRPSEAGLYRDAEAAFQFLVGTRGIAPRSVVIFGQSLGTAVAAHLAAGREVGAVVLEAPFPSASRVARRSFWFLPGLNLLVRGQFDTVKQVRQISAPILIVHCTQDPVLPFEFGEEVYSAARSRKSFLRIDGYGHEEASIIAPAQYRAALQKFLEELNR